jgi:hypothetical protein
MVNADNFSIFETIDENSILRNYGFFGEWIRVLLSNQVLKTFFDSQRYTTSNH